MALRHAISAGIRSLLRVAGEDGVYRRSGQQFDLRLLPAEHANLASALQGFVTDWSTRKWIGLNEHLVLDGERTTPQVDDRWEIETENGTEVWTVAPDREQCWTPLSGCGEAFLLHTVRTS